MKTDTSIAVQAVILGIALIVTILRCWVRLRIEHRSLTVSDWFIWTGWFCALGWIICCVKALRLLDEHPYDEDGLVDSVEYLKTVFVSAYLFDVGLYMPKASILAFYWWLIPVGFRRLRIGLYVGTVYMVCAGIASLLINTLLARPINVNWSVERQEESIWFSFEALTVNWALNITTDLLLFILPFFMITCLKLQRRQKFGLIGIFSLGMFTMIASTIRYSQYAANLDIDEASGDLWCTGEMCTAIIVASLPGLKNLFVRKSTPVSSGYSNSGYNRNPSGYLHAGSGRSGRPSDMGTTTTEIAGGKSDDELELFDLERRPSPCPSSMDAGKKDAQGAVVITKNVTVTHGVF